MLPLLKRLEDGKEHELRELREQVARLLGLTEEERAQLLPSGSQPVFDNRFGWAKTYMEKAGLVQTVRRGVCKITSRGIEALATKPKAINIAFLSRFSEFEDFRRRPSDAEATTAEEPSEIRSSTPEEDFEAAYQELRRETEQALLSAVRSASPGFFERLVVKLLVKMGYGGSIEDPGQPLGRSHDGGVDGMIKEDHLGLEAIYVQAKRWQNPVGRPEIQAFAGSLEGERARKGVFITSSTFTPEARQYVTRIEKKIVLIDGAQLASLMFKFGLGVSTAKTYEIKRVDSDFFSEE